MKVSNLIGLLVILVLAMYFQDPSSIEQEQMRKNMTDFENQTWNIMESFPYTSLYQEQIDTEDVIINSINIMVYPLIAGINTAVPVAIYAMDTGLRGTVLKLIFIGFVLWLLTFSFTAIKGMIALYFFFKEKKKYKERVLD